MAGGHDVHTVGLVPAPSADETAQEYGRRVHRALGERPCSCPPRYSECRWIKHHERTIGGQA